MADGATLVNIGFESPVLTFGNWTQGTTVPAGWTLTQGNFWGGISYPSGWSAIEGNQTLWLQTNNVADGYQSQTITHASSVSAIAGKTYYLNFFATGEYGWGTPNISARLLINGTVKSTLNISNAPAGQGWKAYYVPAYTATASDAGKAIGIQFYFGNLGDPVGHAKTYIDAVTITDAPAEPAIMIESHATKICQIVNDWDMERDEPTLNQTGLLYGWPRIDLGSPFSHNGKTYVLFGDVGGIDVDPIAYTEDLNLEDGLSLTFLENANGSGRPVYIPGIDLGGYEVPMEGVSTNGKMYIYATTDHTPTVAMGRSVVAVSNNNGYNFSYLYDLSVDNFINVSIVKVDTSDWKGFPISQGEGLVMFGSGAYRESNVKLAFQSASQIETKSSIRYFTGLDAAGLPLWSTNESQAIDLFDLPTVGEISVSYNKFIRRWIMLYNDFDYYRGINMRTAKYPWGPWSAPQTIFHPWSDGGYCHFMHITWDVQNCDDVYDVIAGPYVSGGEYGPYQFEDHATGDVNSTTIYFTMSTWNPYTVVLMKATLQKSNQDQAIFLADYNRDSIVNFNDFSKLADNWLMYEPGMDIAPLPCGDGFINLLDLAEFSFAWLND